MRGSFSLLAVAFAVALLMGACQGAGEWLAGKSAAPTPTPTPVPKPPPPESLEVALVMEGGTPYLQERLQNVTIRYEPWVSYQTLQTIKDTFSTAKDVFAEELGVEEIAPITIYVTWEKLFNEFAANNEFQHPAWLAGFASFSYQQGKAVDAKVYVNAQAEGIVHNTAHELTHIATPGLPSWLGEGVAELIGTRVRRLLEPGASNLRELQARSRIRQAIQQGSMLDIYELASFPWMATDSFHTLDLAYAESWQFAEYLSRTSNPSLRTVMAGYDQVVPETVEYFEEVSKVPAASLWSRFKEDILHNTTAEEQVGEALCSLAQLRDDSDLVTQEWNQFLQAVDRNGPGDFNEDFQHFKQQWASLYSSTLDLKATDDAQTVQSLFLTYFSAMEQAMELLSRTRLTAGNRSVAEANEIRIEAYTKLDDALRARGRWLRCEPAP